MFKVLLKNSSFRIKNLPASNTGKVFSSVNLFRKVTFFFPFRLCLSLVQEKPASVQNEIDLIDALKILNDFSVKLLPLQG